MKKIVVRKNDARRIGSFLMYIILVCLSIFLIILSYPIYYWGVLALLCTIPVLCVLLYYETWQVSFSQKEITIKCIFRRTKSYTYFQISDGYIAYSRTEKYHIFLLFNDNKGLQFRLDDKNAEAALRHIQKHRSLRNPEWYSF